MAKVVNRLTHAEHFRMAQWLLSQTLTHEDTIAGLARRHGPETTPSQIKTAMETAGVSIPLPPERQKEADLTTVARELKALYQNLGLPVSPGLERLCK